MTLNPLQAVCCSDHQRCCPSGTRCDLEHDACVSGAAPVPMLKVAAVPSEGTRAVFFPKNQKRRMFKWGNAAETRATDANMLMLALGNRRFPMIPQV